ncbi:DUF5825 family protein [Streptomyces xylophagus]|uniref:DUF5825 family protein n=1 Tax=Streptomyces xylophagus TaxID=285514 RepID=UPI0005BE12EE|nr:DUF5825 family protein [Streptomyces xylophagus]
MPTTTPLTLTTWRDHDEEVLQLPVMSPLVTVVAESATPAETAAELYGKGVRRVTLDRPADLSGATGARAIVSTMLLVGELTSWGIVVDWDVALGADPEVWRSFNHLHPPRQILDTQNAEDIRQEWRSTFYVGKCVYRKGPGFVQVRDRRAGGLLARYTLDDPAYLEAVDRLSAGCPADAVPSAVLDHLVGESLAGRAGQLAWWLPYRVHRWPWPSFAV